MAESSVMLSVPQLVDLALNSPEMGVINFNMLHALLHVLVQQAELTSSTVEFRGINGEKVQSLLNSMKPAQAVNVSEYIVNKEGGKAKKKEDTQAAGSSADTVILVETVTESISTPHVSVAFSKAHLKELHEEIDEVKQRVKELLDMPSNTALINASRDKSQPIVDMFQLLTLNKRITANEEGLTKMASMIEDLARTTDGPVMVDAKDKKRGSITSAPDGGLIGRLANLEQMLGVQATPEAQEQKMNIYNEVIHLKDIVENLKQQHQVLIEQTNATVAPGTTAKVTTIAEGGAGKEKEHGATDTGAPASLKSSPTKASGAAVHATTSGTVPRQHSANNTRASVADSVGASTMTSMTKKFEDCSAHIQLLDSMFRKETADVQDQLRNLEEVVEGIVDKLKVGCDTASGSDIISTGEMQNKFLQMQTDVENLAETANKLIADKEAREISWNAMQEEIELLKTVKADREDLEDALADKADACAVNRKVSHDQFDAACDDLTKGIEEALEKLTQQELLWHQALNEIQKEIAGKLDKSELLPLRDFINSKLKLLQDRLKDLTKMKKEAEAAGVRSKYLKDVNCISCDKDVVMRKQLDSATMPKPYAMPANTKSLAPYLAYELDNLRKQQKCFPHGRNLNNFEKAGNIPKGGVEDHICNRYCGGSHTVTTPQQRVTRLGHFVQQWGPGVLPMAESVVRGTDGQMYKSSEPAALLIQGETTGSPRKSGEGDAPLASSNERRSSKDKRPMSDKGPAKTPRVSSSSIKATAGDGKQPSAGTRRASAGSNRAASSASIKQMQADEQRQHHEEDTGSVKQPEVGQSEGESAREELEGEGTEIALAQDVPEATTAVEEESMPEVTVKSEGENTNPDE